ncbi:solute carrier family 22 member 6-A [Magallana gigas]|uniref:solute carrier family 22 member 6-A n=1 Tax=Magallana gigas TaxID=29159 RepID=UPI003340426B
MANEVNNLLENVLEETGGLGRFQFILIALINVCKVPVTWSVLMMMFGGATPDWWCGGSRNSSLANQNTDSLNGSEWLMTSSYQVCSVNGSVACDDRYFDPDMNTVISEWGLVCGESWVPGVIISIQMVGLLTSGYLSGQLADLFGRRLILFLAILLNSITNFAAAFSSSWQMFAGFRFLIGFSCGLYLATYLTYLIEFTPQKYRPMIQAVPSWSLGAAAYGLLSWLLHDWRYLQMLTGAVGLPFLACWIFIPESFRWLVSHKKIDKAKEVIEKIAKLNRVAAPDLKEIEVALQKSHTVDRKYTVLDICRHGYLLKRAAVVSFAWIAMAYNYYGISFGVDKLSGSLYLNMFILSVLEFPGAFLSWFFMNKIGRRKSYFIFTMLSTAGAVAVGVTENLEFTNQGSVINGFAFLTKIGGGLAWSCVFIITTESYPTVLRTTGYGLASSLCRIGPILAPLSLSLSATLPGFLYFSCGAVSFISGLSIFCIAETKDKALEDLIGSGHVEETVIVADSETVVETSK